MFWYTLSNRSGDHCLVGKKKVPRWHMEHRGASVNLRKIPARDFLTMVSSVTFLYQARNTRWEKAHRGPRWKLSCPPRKTSVKNFPSPLLLDRVFWYRKNCCAILAAHSIDILEIRSLFESVMNGSFVNTRMLKWPSGWCACLRRHRFPVQDPGE